MPLVRVDLNRGRSKAAVTAIADAIHDAIHDAIVETYEIPVRDRFQIFTQRGRSSAAEQSLYAGINARLGLAGVAGRDVFIGNAESGADDWSFGFGAAQYITGEIAVPASGSPVQ